MSGLSLGLQEGCGDGVCAISSWKDTSIPGRSCIPRRLSAAELGPDTTAGTGFSAAGQRPPCPGAVGTLHPAPPAQGRGGGSAELRPLPRPRPLPLAGRERGRAGPGEEEQPEPGPDRGGSSGAPEVCAAGGGGSRSSSRRFRGPAGRSGAERAGEGSGAAAGREPSRAAMKKPDGKVVLLGDMNVGKTSLLHRYMERRFQETVSTVGGAFYLKQWGPYNISIWDTAGERHPRHGGDGVRPGAPGVSRRNGAPRNPRGVCWRAAPVSGSGESVAAPGTLRALGCVGLSFP